MASSVVCPGFKRVSKPICWESHLIAIRTTAEQPACLEQTKSTRPCTEVLKQRRQLGGNIAGASDVLRDGHPKAYGDEMYASACSNLAYSISKHCTTYYQIADIDTFARGQLISMDPHGAKVDRNVAGRLIYFTQEQALHHRVIIHGGKLYVDDGSAVRAVDTTQMTLSAGNTAHQGGERNNYDWASNTFGPTLGVAGFAMTLNRDLFVHGGHSIRGRDGAAYSFYHSSYVSGEDVVCTESCSTSITGAATIGLPLSRCRSFLSRSV